jgi:hypothetical protein
MVGCSKSNPTTPGQGQYSYQSNFTVIGSWEVESSGFERSAQTLQGGLGPHVVLHQILGDDHSGTYADLKVSTEGFDREAQTLKLRFEATNIDSDHPLWYEPRLVIEFDADTNLVPSPQYDDPTLFSGNPKDKYLVLDATAHTNVLHLQDDPTDFDPYCKAGESLQFSSNPVPLVVEMSIQIPVSYLTEQDDQIARWNVFLLGSEHSIYAIWDEDTQSWIDPTVLDYPAEPYDITDQRTSDPVIKSSSSPVIELRCSVLTKYPIPPGYPPLWDDFDYHVQADTSILDGSPAPHWIPLDNPVGGLTFSGLFPLSGSVQPGVYWLPIQAWLDLPTANGQVFEGMPNPRIQDVVRVVVVAGDAVDAPIPGGYRICYLKDISGTRQIWVSDTLTHKEYPLTFDPNRSVKNFDIAGNTPNLIFEAEDSSGNSMCYWLCAGYSPVPVMSCVAGRQVRNPRICEDGSAGVFMSSEPNPTHPQAPKSHVYIERFNLSNQQIGVNDAYTTLPAFPYLVLSRSMDVAGHWGAKLSCPSIASYNTNTSQGTVYLVMFGTDANTNNTASYSTELYESSNLEFAAFKTIDLTQVGVSEIFRGTVGNTKGSACSRPVIAPDCGGLAWTAGTGNQDLFVTSFGVSPWPAPNPPRPSLYENWFGNTDQLLHRIDSYPMFSYYPEMSSPYQDFLDSNPLNDIGRLTVFRQGNNKNSDICVWFEKNVPYGLTPEDDHRVKLTDINDPDEEYSDFNGYEDWPDISPDGYCITFMSQAENHGDIFYADISGMVNVSGSSDANLAIWKDIRRLTNNGICSHPRISGRIPEEDLPY